MEMCVKQQVDGTATIFWPWYLPTCRVFMTLYSININYAHYYVSGIS